MSVVKRQPSDVKNVKKYKIVIIGDCGSGKSSLLLKFVEGTFQDNHYATIGVDLKAKYINIDGTTVKINIWDTAGQERFRSIIGSYYSTASGIILVFDLTNRESFLNLKIWIDELKSIDKDDKQAAKLAKQTWLDLKSRIHKALVEEMDLKKSDKNDPKEQIILKEKTRKSVIDILGKEDTKGILNSREDMNQIVKEVLDEALGLGPLEDLLEIGRAHV